MWNDPELLETLQTVLQWIAILLVFLGGAVEIILQLRETKTTWIRHWFSRLQWIAIVLIFFSGLLQFLTLIVSNREKALTAVLDRATILKEQSQQGSWSAYRELVQLANQHSYFKKSFDLHLKLIQMKMLIYRDIPGIRSNLEYKIAGKDIPIENLAASELFELLSRPSSSVLMRQSLQGYILQKPKGDILKACNEILKKSDSLPARAAACGILSRIMGSKTDFFDFENWVKITQSEIEEMQY